MKDRLPSSTGLFDLIETDVATFDALRKAESIGRPVGSEAFLDRIARQIGKAVKPGRRGRSGGKMHCHRNSHDKQTADPKGAGLTKSGEGSKKK
jgi:hypothetical protein